MRNGPFLFFLAAVPVAAYLAYRGWKQEQKRRELLFRWSVDSGFRYSERDDTWCERWSGPPFGDGDHRQAHNVVTGRAGEREFTAFDYSYETHSTDSKGHTTTTTHRYVVTSLGLPCYLPGLQVTPESLFGRIGTLLGLDDIELESEDFNRRFRVQGSDRKFASDVLTPRTMEAMLRFPDLSWRIEGSDVLAWDDGRMLPARVLAMTAALQTVVDGIPSFVWKDHS